MPCKLIQHNLLRFISSEAHCTCRGRTGGGKEGREGGRAFRARGDGWGRGLRECVCSGMVHTRKHAASAEPKPQAQLRDPETSNWRDQPSHKISCHGIQVVRQAEGPFFRLQLWQWDLLLTQQPQARVGQVAEATKEWCAQNLRLLSEAREVGGAL